MFLGTDCTEDRGRRTEGGEEISTQEEKATFFPCEAVGFFRFRPEIENGNKHPENPVNPVGIIQGQGKMGNGIT